VSDIEPGSGIETRKLFGRQVRNTFLNACGSTERRVVDDDRHPILRKSHIELDSVCPVVNRAAKSPKRIFGSERA